MNKFKQLIFVALLNITFDQLPAQNQIQNVDAGYKIFYKETSIETDDYKIYIEDAMSVDAWTKFKVRVFNKTNDYIIFDPADVIFKINGKEIPGNDKPLYVMPNDEATKVIDAKNKGSQVYTYSVEIKQMFKASASVAPLKTEDFNIPITKNEFQTGNFKCTAKSAAIKTDKSLLKFLCVYQGDAIGILTPIRAVAEMPGKQEIANTNRNKGTLLEKNKQDDFLIELKEVKGAGDMQKDHFFIKWNDTFKESKKEVIPGGKFTLEFDQPKTAERNK